MTIATLGYVIRHVPDVARSARCYKAAFGLKTRLIYESGSYIELDTDTTTLTFATPGLIRDLGVDTSTAGEAPPFGTELAFVVPNVEVEATVDRAISAAIAPTRQPWSQLVAFLHDPDSLLM